MQDANTHTQFMKPFAKSLSAQAHPAEDEKKMEHHDTYDLWAEADMESVIRYLRSNKKLNVPNHLREVLGMNRGSAD